MTAGGLRIGFQVWSQYVDWSELMAIGREIDELGFDELWSNDHLLPQAAGAVGAESGPRDSLSRSADNHRPGRLVVQAARPAAI